MPERCSPLLLVRHAAAGNRDYFDGPDHRRPLSERGQRQADALVDQYRLFAVTRILSSPYLRCVQTVEPLAAARGLAVEPVDELAEGEASRAIALAQNYLEQGVVLCTHGDVLPRVLIALAGPDPAGRVDLPCQKGSTWVVASRPPDLAYLPPPA